MVSYGVAVSSLAVKFLFRQLMYSLRISVRVISVGPLSTLRHVALKETYPQPWSDIMVKETREVNGRTFYFFQDINTRRGGSMQKSSGSEPESSHGIRFGTS